MLRILVLAVAVVLLSACEEEDLEPVATQADNNPIIIGDTSGMTVIQFNRSITGFPLEVDIDFDSIPDLSFVSGWYGSMGGGYDKRTDIQSLDSLTNILAVTEVDTTFKGPLSSIVDDGYIWVIYQTMFTCDQSVLEDSVTLTYTNEVNKIITLQEGEPLLSKNWLVGSVRLTSELQHSTPSGGYASNDTNYVFQTLHYRDCDLLIEGEVQYLGFNKTTSLEINYSGWIKVHRIDEYHIYVHEVAIRESL